MPNAGRFNRQDTDRQRGRLVRPARLEQGGASAPAFGLGAPPMATAQTQRQQDLAQRWADDVRGRFTERVFRFPDVGFVAPQTQSNESVLEVQSNRTSFVRLVAIRGGIKLTSDGILGPFDLANIELDLSLNGEENLTSDGQAAVPVEFDGLFSNTSAPWFWFAAPPRVRVGDTMNAQFTNSLALGAHSIQPYLISRLVDDAWWRALYGT